MDNSGGHCTINFMSNLVILQILIAPNEDICVCDWCSFVFTNTPISRSTTTQSDHKCSQSLGKTGQWMLLNMKLASWFAVKKKWHCAVVGKSNLGGASGGWQAHRAVYNQGCCFPGEGRGPWRWAIPFHHTPADPSRQPGATPAATAPHPFQAQSVQAYLMDWTVTKAMIDNGCFGGRTCFAVLSQIHRGGCVYSGGLKTRCQGASLHPNQ